MQNCTQLRLDLMHTESDHFLFVVLCKLLGFQQHAVPVHSECDVQLGHMTFDAFARD